MTVEELRPRMMLARDLLSAQGAILLPQGHKFTNEVIRKVTEFVGRAEIRLDFHILCKSIEPLPAAAPAPAPAPAPKQKQVH